MTFRFEVFSDWSQLPASLDDLFCKAEHSTPFMTRAWFDSLVEHALEVNQSVMLACVQRDQEVHVLLPLMYDNDDELCSLSSRYSALYSTLVIDILADEVMQCLAQGLHTLNWKAIRLEPVADNDEALTKLQNELSVLGWQCQQHFRFHNWIHRVEESDFESYMASRPGKVRNTIERKSRKLEREHGYEIRLYTCEDLDRGIQDYNAVYRSSWKVNEPYQALVESMMRAMSNRGSLRLAILYIAGQPVAAQIWFVDHGIASIMRLAYVESWKAWSPGSILTRYLMRHVIDIDKVKVIDYLMGNESYKQDWMTECRQRFCIECRRAENGPGWLNRLKTIFSDRTA